MNSIRSRVSRWRRFTTWVNKHQNISVSLIGVMILASGALGVYTMAYLMPEPILPTGEIPRTQAKKEESKKYYSPLTGKEVPDEAATKRLVTAIMIENSPSARPQSGIKDAGVVFEAIAEGGITRFLTLYQEARPSLIGPVRSLRPYYIDWLAPFDPAVAHIGGSKNALIEIRNGSYKDIDQFFNAGAYWRATDRYAPHNVYTNFDRLDALNQKKGYTSSSFTGWPRKRESPTAKTLANKIDITVSGPTYNVSYAYDKPNNDYVRSVGGALHKDREAGQLNPKVVVAIKVPTQIGFEDGYREQMTTTGFNKAYIFQDGTVYEGFWRKPGKKDQLQFYDSMARPVYFNPGQVWLTAIAPNRSVTWQ